MFRIEFFNTSSQSWLAAHHDFDCASTYETEADAQEWINDQNSFERSEGQELTSFSIVAA